DSETTVSNYYRPQLNVVYYLTCSDGYADCNSNGCDGCEVNIESDSNNCGGCGTICSAGDTCQSGACAPCSSNLQTDSNNCGACGNVCSAGDTCQNGACSTDHGGGTCSECDGDQGCIDCCHCLMGGGDPDRCCF